MNNNFKSLPNADFLTEDFSPAYWLSAIVESADDAIISKTLDGIITSWNRGAENIFGYAADEMIGKSISILFPPDLFDVEEPQIIQSVKNGQTVEHYETTRIKKDGTPVEVSLTISPVKSRDGKIIGVSKIAREITGRKIIEKALRRSEELYRIVAETASDAIISIDERSVILFVNRAASRIFGYEIEEMIEQPLTMLMPEYLRALHRAGFSRYLAVHKRHLSWDHVEVTGLHRDGHEFPLELSFGEYSNNDEHLFIGIARDVTDRKRTEKMIYESELKFSALAESLPQLVWMAEPDGSIFWYNRNWYAYTGTTFEDMQGWGWQTVHDPQMLPQVVERWKFSIDSGEPFEMEFPLKSVSGEFRWFLTRVNPLRDSDGRIVRWFGTNTDVHERRIAQLNAEFLAAVSEDLLRTGDINEVIQTVGEKIGDYLHLSLCAFVEINETRNQSIVTHEWHRENAPSILGTHNLDQYLQKEFQGGDAIGNALVVGDVFADRKTKGENFRSLGIGSFVCIPLVRDGHRQFLFAVHDSDPRSWLDNEIDLMRELAARIWRRLERFRAEEEREHLLENERIARKEAEKMNRLKDDFLATLSHELRTPLNAILGWSQLLRKADLKEDDKLKAVTTIERNARSQSQLIDDILDVSRIITGKFRLDVRAVDLPDVIEAATDTARPAADAKNIRLQMLLDPQAGPISGDPDRLQQVVWNLLSNAIKFTPKDGRVQVRLERVNSHIEIVVSDTGKGIEPEFLPFVFDRFRQSDGSMTRRHGGLGLGLAIVRQIIELHGGSVSVTSEGVDRGATFTINLPLLPVRRETPGDVLRAHPSAPIHEDLDCPEELNELRILLVDDEADSRDLLKLVLSSCGAEVLTASSAIEALQTMKENQFNLIISDIGMPDENGFSLIRKIRRLSPENGGEVPAIALTAYARAEDRVQAMRCGFQMHIAKPVEPTELVAAAANIARRTR